MSFHVFAVTEESTGEQRKSYRSCARTKADEEYLMIRLQVFCLLLGVVSFASVRKQKAVTASLFDQRKIQQRPDKKRASQLIEMTAIAEEAVPLTDNSTLEVV